MKLNKVERNGTIAPLREALNRGSDSAIIRKSASDSFLVALRRAATSDNLTSPFRQHPWIRAACNNKANNVSKVRYKIFKGKYEDIRSGMTEEGVVTPLDTSDPIARLFRFPNKHMSGTEMRKAISVHLDIVGEAFLLIVESNKAITEEFDSSSRPVEFWLIPNPAKNVREEEENGEVVAWKVKQGSKEVLVPYSRLIHFKEYNPDNPYRGLSLWEAIKNSGNIDWTALNYLRTLLENGGDPGGYLSSESEPGVEEKEEIRNEFRRKFRGWQGAASEIPYFSGGLKYTQLQIDNHKMQHKETREAMRDEILAVLGVPKQELALVEDVNRSTAEIVRQIYWENTLSPRILMIDAVFENQFFRVLDDNVSVLGRSLLEEVPALQEGFSDRVEAAERLAKINYPLNAINDRLELGMPELDYGDEPLVPVTLVPLSESGVRQEQDASKAEKATVLLNERDKEWVAYEKEFFHPAERTFLRGYRALLKVQRKKQLDAFDKYVRRPSRKELPPLSESEIDQFLLSETNWKGPVQGAMRKPVAEVISATLRRLRSELGGFNVISPNFNDPWILANGASKLATLVQVSLEDRVALRRILIKEISENGVTGVQALRSKIAQFFAPTDGEVVSGSAHVRALRIARTETANLSNAIRYRGMEEEGVKRHKWLSARDAFVRPASGTGNKPGQPNHRKLDGEVREIGKPFSNGLRYPAESGGPAGEVINCRCVLVPEAD